MTGEGKGNERTSSPLPLPLQPFLASALTFAQGNTSPAKIPILAQGDSRPPSCFTCSTIAEGKRGSTRSLHIAALFPQFFSYDTHVTCNMYLSKNYSLFVIINSSIILSNKLINNVMLLSPVLPSFFISFQCTFWPTQFPQRFNTYSDAHVTFPQMILDYSQQLFQHFLTFQPNEKTKNLP